MKLLDLIAAILQIIGCLNWGLIGVANFNLVTKLLGTSPLVDIIYILVGLAALYQIFQWKAIHRRWSCK
ncbi:MAG: DUF378 domain-containing protein [Chlamydiae bacterium]|nr:DUF378 domain-containing protein [Chlamydiota bacterium]